jgi:hypothetical protein
MNVADGGVAELPDDIHHFLLEWSEQVLHRLITSGHDTPSFPGQALFPACG